MSLLTRIATNSSSRTDCSFAFTFKLLGIVPQLGRHFLFERLSLFFANNETHKRFRHAHHPIDLFLHFTVIATGINTVVPKIHLYQRLQTFSLK